MPDRVVADMGLLEAYAGLVAEHMPSRWEALEAVAAALSRFFSSDSAHGPTASGLPDTLVDLFVETATDGVGALATAAAFRDAEVVIGGGGVGAWQPTDVWVEQRRRAWLLDHGHGGLEAASPTMERDAIVVESVGDVDALTDAINAWSGSDNDPVLDQLLGARDEILMLLADGDPAVVNRTRSLVNGGVGAGLALETALREAAIEARIDEVMGADGIGRAEAIVILELMDARIAELIHSGCTGEEAVLAFAIAETVGLDLDEALAHANHGDTGLVEVLGAMAAASGLDMSFSEFRAYRGLGAFFDVFDNVHGEAADGRVSVGDLEYVVGHPGEFLTAQVAAARALLDEPILRNRLDTAAENVDILDGGAFGRREAGDGVISRDDLDAFMTGAYLNRTLQPHASAIDTAANGGDADGRVSRRDLEAWLDNPANGDVPLEVREGVEFMLDAQLFDRSWWERNRNALAMGAAVLGGGAVIVLTAGTATPLVLTLGAGFVAGGVAASGSTMAVNHFTGRGLDDDVLANALNGGFIGMSVAGLPTTWAHARTITHGLTPRSGVAVGGLASEVTGIVGGGGVDLLVPDHWERDVHRVTNTTSLVTGLPGLVYDGATFAMRPRRGAEVPAMAAGPEQLALDLDVQPSDGLGRGAGATTPVRVPGNDLDAVLDAYTFDGFMSPGPLAGHPRNPMGSFYAGRYSVDVLERPSVVYRAGAADGPEFGSWYTAEPVRSVPQARIDLAVRPQWIDPRTGVLTGSSRLDTVYAIEVPAGTTVYRGPVAAQGGATMGNPHVEQLFIEETWRIGDVVGRIGIGEATSLLPTSAPSRGRQLRFFDDARELGQAVPSAAVAAPLGISLSAPSTYAPANLGRSYGGMVVIDPGVTRLMGFGGSVESGHALNRIIQRAVGPVDVLGTLRRPVVVLAHSSLGGARYLYLSASAAVVVDDSGQVVTVWARADFNEVSERILREAAGGGE